MGNLKTVKDGIITLLEAAVPSGTVVLAGVDPAAVDVEEFPAFVVLVPRDLSYQENITTSAVTQWAYWTWDVYVRVGHAGTANDAIDEVNATLNALVAGLQNEKPTDDCGPLELRNLGEFAGFLHESPVYRQEWYHELQPS